MADFDVERIADAYVDADAFDPLAYDTVDVYENDGHEWYDDANRPPCSTCEGTKRVPHPTLPYTRAVPCPDCTGGGAA